MLINSAPRGFVLVDASAKTSTWRRYSRRACLPDQARGGYRGGVAGASWWLRHSCYPTLLASQLALQLARPSRGATVYTNAPKRLRETISTNLCTLLCPHGRSCDRGAGRFLEQRALPLGGERAGVERSGPSGSVTHTRPHAQGRVAVQLTLPNGIERTEAVRSGPSGSAIGTLKGEWQCSLHCHSAVNVWWWNVQARVAV